MGKAKQSRATKMSYEGLFLNEIHNFLYVLIYLTCFCRRLSIYILNKKKRKRLKYLSLKFQNENILFYFMAYLYLNYIVRYIPLKDTMFYRFVMKKVCAF